MTAKRTLAGERRSALVVRKERTRGHEPRRRSFCKGTA
jgi:hypothetical protein